jgi:hypothetical protein
MAIPSLSPYSLGSSDGRNNTKVGVGGGTVKRLRLYSYSDDVYGSCDGDGRTALTSGMATTCG